MHFNIRVMVACADDAQSDISTTNLYQCIVSCSVFTMKPLSLSFIHIWSRNLQGIEPGQSSGMHSVSRFGYDIIFGSRRRTCQNASLEDGYR